MHARQSEQYKQQLAYFAEVEAQAEAIRSSMEQHRIERERAIAALLDVDVRALEAVSHER
jgi:hypothetical protein